MDKELNKTGLCEEWEYLDNSISEGEWTKLWTEYTEAKKLSAYRVGDIVEYYGKRCKIVEDSGIDPTTGEEFFLLEIVDENERTKMTWWAGKGEISPWRGAKSFCECGALHVKGSENFHAVWCPAYKQRS